MPRSRLIAWGAPLALAACATASPPTESHVTLLGVTAPERTAGYVAFLIRRSEDPAKGVTFMYTPPLDTEPGISVDVYPFPASASATYLRDQLEAGLESWRRPRRVGEQAEIDPVEQLTVVGSDGVRYEGWRSRVRIPGSRMVSYLYFLEKESHVVQYRFQDDNLDPTLTEAGARDFVAGFIGELRFRALPADLRTLPEDTRRVAVRPPGPSPVGPDSLLSREELERVDDVREAALRWAFANNGSDLHPPAVHCVAVGRVDASAALLSRFADSDVPVRPGSYCERLPLDATNLRDTSRHSIVDPASGEFGLWFQVGRIAWTGDSSAEVDVQYGQGGTWGTGWRCNADQAGDGTWRISGCRKTVDR